MRKFDRRLRGTVRLELCGACPEAVLNACAMSALELMELESIDACTLRVTVFETRVKEFVQIARRCMCETETVSVKGGSKNRRFVKRRVMFIVFAAVTAGILLLSSLFIWDIQVQGCEKLSSGQVLRALADCGVEQGALRRTVCSDMVRSRVMVELPEIAWMTVNVRGSKATVLILEREEKPEIYIESKAADMVAAKTGIISRMSVLNGFPLVSPGQSVVKGETLVSGTVDSITAQPRLLRAAGSVTADTWYEICACRPAEEDFKSEDRKKRFRFALQIGKKRINFYFGGRKDVDECDKIIDKYKMGIEGLFLLPVSLVMEELSFYDSFSGESGAAEEMQRELYEYLLSQVDGDVLSSDFTVGESNGLLCVTLRAHCLENIAQIKEITQAET